MSSALYPTSAKQTPSAHADSCGFAPAGQWVMKLGTSRIEENLGRTRKGVIG